MNIPMHRFKYTKLTKDQIGKALKVTEAGPKCESEFSDVLEGKSIKIVTTDGSVQKPSKILPINCAPTVMSPRSVPAEISRPINW